MKFLLTFAVLSSFCGLSYCLTKDEANEIFLNASKQCQKQTDATDDDIQNFKLNKLSVSPASKCFGACLLQSLGLFVTPENVVNKSGVMMGIGILFPNDPTQVKITEEIVDSCASITDPNECEAAFKIAGCLKAGYAAKGLSLPMV